MPDYLGLQIVGVNGSGNSTVENYQGIQLYVDETVPAGQVIGKIDGFDPAEDVSRLVFTPDTTSGGGYGDAGGRYQIVRASAEMVGNSTEYSAGDWVVVLTAVGAQAHDYESGAMLERIQFSVASADPTYTLKSAYGVAFEFRIADVNEAPDDLSIGGIVVDGAEALIFDEEIAGLEIGVLEAADQDDLNNMPDAPISYSIVTGADNNWLQGQMFEITADNRLKLRQDLKLDWEQAPNRNSDETERWYEVVIRATDSGGYDASGFPDPLVPPTSKDTAVRICVNNTEGDFQNMPPNTILLDGGLAKTVAENVTVLGEMTAVDDNNAIDFFTIVGGDEGNLFEIVRNTTSGHFELRVRSEAVLDYEAIADAGKTFTLQITATDTDEATSEVQDITITVTDENDAPSAPVWTPGSTINENAQDGDVVGVLASTDQDGDPVNIKFQNASDAAGLISGDGAFRIVRELDGTHHVVVNDATKLPFSAGASKNFPYVVYATDGSVDSTATAVDITVDSAPPMVAFAGSSAPSITQPEGNPAGTAAEYTDYSFFLVRTGDLSAESDVEWVLSGTGLTADDVAGGAFTGTVHFAVNQDIAMVTVRIKKDRTTEGEETFTLTLQPQAGGNGNAVIGANNTGEIIVQEDDNVNGQPHSIVLIGGTTNTTATLSETIEGGHVVGTLSAQDDGGGDNLTFTLVAGYAGAALFQINADGEIVLNGALNYEAAITTVAGAGLEQDADGKFYRLLVRATDEGNPQEHGDQEIKIYVTNVNEAPNLSTGNGTVTINETANNGDTVAGFTLSHPEGEADLVYTIVLAGAPASLTADAFEVDAVNKRIVVKDKTLLEVAESATFTLTLTVRDLNGATGFLSDTQDFTVTVRNVDPNNAPPILVADAVTKIIAHDQNTALVNPFSAVGITETNADDDVTVTITLDDDAKGVLSSLGGFTYDPTNKRYTFTGSAAAAELAIRTLDYNPRDRADSTVSETTTFTITVDDESGATVTSSNIKVESTPTIIPNSAPTGLSLSGAFVWEYAAPNTTEIGTFSATDADGDALTYTLLDNAGGRFAIANNKLMLAGPGVNFDEAKSHQIKVQVSDGTTSVEQVFTINVGDQLTLNKRGTSRDDRLNGSAQDDILKGGGGSGRDTIKGLAGDDKLYGENGDDTLMGGEGLDTLYGELGNDKLYGGAGADIFVFSKRPNKVTNFDRIYDFKSGEDKLYLDDAIFTKLGKIGTFDAPVKLDASLFATGRAKDSKDYLVYKSGVLYYDTNGSRAGGAVEIVKVSGLKVTDIFII